MCKLSIYIHKHFKFSFKIFPLERYAVCFPEFLNSSCPGLDKQGSFLKNVYVYFLLCVADLITLLLADLCL